MRRFLVGIWGLIISVVLFVGFNTVNLLSESVDFFKTWKLYFYGGFAFLFILQQIWLQRPKPVTLSEVDSMRDAVERLLGTAHDDYLRNVSSSSNKPAPNVRMNIMLPTWRRFRWGRYLRIYYVHGGRVGTRYPDDEIDLQWRRKGKEGTCGFAWAKERPTIYDSQNSAYKAPEKRLTEKQKKVVGHINSVLSIPIRSEQYGKVIGVLNCDSKHNANQTLFHHEDVIYRMSAWAKRVSTMLFADGVGPN